MVRKAARAMQATRPRPSVRILPKLAKHFGANVSGVAGVEFAFILPIMLVLYLGGVELSDALTIQRKVTTATSSLTDLVTQAKTISNNDIKNILDAAATIISPYDESRMKIKVSGIAIDSKGKATVQWSDARNDQPLARNSVVALPAGVNEKNSFVVSTEVHYDYKPAIGYVMTGNFDLNDQFYLRPRLSAEVNRVP